jgi:hypothetical protein
MNKKRVREGKQLSGSKKLADSGKNTKKKGEQKC